MEEYVCGCFELLSDDSAKASLLCEDSYVVEGHFHLSVDLLDSWYEHFEQVFN